MNFTCYYIEGVPQGPQCTEDGIHGATIAKAAEDALRGVPSIETIYVPADAYGVALAAAHGGPVRVVVRAMGGHVIGPAMRKAKRRSPGEVS